MATTLEKLNQTLTEKTREFTGTDQLRTSIDTIGYAMQYMLAEGNRFSDADTLSIIRALNILRSDFQTIHDLRVSISRETVRQARDAQKSQQE